MTVTVFDRRLEYPGNDIATVFDGPRAFDASDIAVYMVNDSTGDASLMVLDTDYTLDGLALANTEVTMDTAPATGFTLLVLRTLTYTNDTRFTDQGAFFASLHEDEFDRCAMRDQQLSELVERSLRLSDTLVGDYSTEIPRPAAGASMRWDVAGTALESYLPGDTLEWQQSSETAGRALAATDAFRRLVYGDYGNATFYLAANIFAAGDEFILVNDSSYDLTLTPNNAGSTAPVTLYHAGRRATWLTSGAVIDAHSVARVYMTTASRGYIICDQPSLTLPGSLSVVGTSSVTKRTLNGVSALGSTAGVLAIDLTVGNYFTLDLTENVTSITFSNALAYTYAQNVRIRIKQHASAAKTVAWPASFKWPAGSAPSVSEGASAYDVLTITSYDQGTRWEAGLVKALA